MSSDERPVELYIYDLSQGLARQLSLQLIGIHIDAVYHTSIVVGGKEYYFGHGIQMTDPPGSTHHGRPMEIIPLGLTSLPDDILLEYMESMKSEYSPESYDLFVHNCNNFTADLAMFLCGRSIPGHIKNLPKQVLDTPLGQMLRPALERQLRPITNAPLTSSGSQICPLLSGGRVHTANSLSEFERILGSADSKCAVAFFTSATCPPCRMVYPHFEQLASEGGVKAVYIKVDVGVARDVGMKYSISATPTFMTWSKGEKIDEWKGASPVDLKSNVQMLYNMTYPVHPHTNVSLPMTTNTLMKPIAFNKIPPLDKLVPKLGDAAKHPAVSAQLNFLKNLNSQGAANAPIPDLVRWGSYLQESYADPNPQFLFPLVDLFRASVSDPRVSGFFAEEKDHKTVQSILKYATPVGETVLYPLRLVTVQAICNLFTSALFPEHLLSAELCGMSVELVTSCLLDKAHTHLRAAAGSLAFNIAVYVQQQRSQNQREVLDGENLVELAASFLECTKEETESKDVVRALTLSLALIVYCSPLGGELIDVLKALEAGKIIREKASKGGLGDQVLCSEVSKLLEL